MKNPFKLLSSMSCEFSKFARYWINEKPINLDIENSCTFKKDLFVKTIYQESVYQVQLVEMQKGFHCPEHSHPDVDGLVFYNSGDFEFGIGNDIFKTRSSSKRYSAMMKKDGIHVARNELHFVRCPVKGGSFISIQKWYKEEKESVTDNWNGEELK